MLTAPFYPGRAFYLEFPTHSLTTGAAANADSLPTAVVARNGAADGSVTPVVTNIGTGEYAVSFTVPAGYLTTDAVTLRVNALVNTQPVKLRLNCYCPVPPDVAGETFDRYMRGLTSFAYGKATPNGNQVTFTAADNGVGRTVTLDPAVTGKRTAST